MGTPKRMGIGVAGSSIALTVLCLSMAAGAATAGELQRQVLSDEALSAVVGQGMLELSNTTLGGVDFTRITLNSDIRLSANLSAVRLGQYDFATRNGTGADIDIGMLRLGRSDQTDANRLVTLTDPYLELAYKNTGGAREAVGFRVGFGSIAGSIGVSMSSVSGTLRFDAGQAGLIDSSIDGLGGKRWDGTCAPASCLALSAVTGLQAGDVSGASRDLWLAITKVPVQFAAAPGMPLPPATQAGFWLNWTDRLTALLSTTAPPNAPKRP